MAKKKAAKKVRKKIAKLTVTESQSAASAVRETLRGQPSLMDKTSEEIRLATFNCTGVNPSLHTIYNVKSEIRKAKSLRTVGKLPGPSQPSEPKVPAAVETGQRVGQAQSKNGAPPNALARLTPVLTLEQLGYEIYEHPNALCVQDGVLITWDGEPISHALSIVAGLRGHGLLAIRIGDKDDEGRLALHTVWERNIPNNFDKGCIISHERLFFRAESSVSAGIPADGDILPGIGTAAHV